MTIAGRVIFTTVLVLAASLSTRAMTQTPEGSETDTPPSTSVWDRVPEEIDGTGIDERLGESLPLDLTFQTGDGRTVRLGDLVRDDRPTIITPVFYDCPQLCTLTLNGLCAGMNPLEESLGIDFNMVTYSFNPDETVKLAGVKKRAYLTQYRRDSAADGWHFLVGDAENIAALNEAIGLRINRGDDGTYAHPPCVVFITPDGRISRYMNDVMFKPRDLRLALMEASEGTIGSPLEHFFLINCWQYDPDKNSYTWAAFKLMRLVGVMTVLTIVIGVGCLAAMGQKNRRTTVNAEAGATAGDNAMADGER